MLLPESPHRIRIMPSSPTAHPARRPLIFRRLAFGLVLVLLSQTISGCDAGVAFLRAAVDVLNNLGPLGNLAGAIAGALGDIDGKVRDVVDKAKERAKLPDRTGYPANPPTFEPPGPDPCPDETAGMEAAQDEQSAGGRYGPGQQATDSTQPLPPPVTPS